MKKAPSIVKDREVMFGVVYPVVDTPAVGVCIKNDRPGIVTGRCPIAGLPQLTEILPQIADACRDCNHQKLNGIENSILPGRIDYGSTQSLMGAVRRDISNMPPEPTDAEIKELLVVLQVP